MKKRVLSLFLAITLCLSLTPTGALAEESLPGQTVVATQETETPTPAPQKEEPLPKQTVAATQETETPTHAPQKEESTAPAENGADENASPASPDEKPTENTPAAPEKNPADEEPGKEAGQNEPTAEGENEPLTLGLDDATQNAAEGENGEGSGGTHYVAESGGTQYETVQEILDEIEEGEITLLDSVTEDLAVYAATTIHMNGYSITGNIDATDSLTLNGGTVDGTVTVDATGGTFTMTAPAEAEAAITGGLNVVSGSAFVSGAQVGVKGTLYFDGTDMLISGAVKAVELDSAAEPAAKTLYGSATVNGDTAAEAGFDTDTYKVGGEIAKKLTNKQVGSTTPAAPSLTLTETSKSLTAGKTAVFTANYTGTDTLNAYVQGSAVNGYFTISQKNNGDGTYTVSVKIDEETPGGTYTLFVHELGNTSVQASATITVTGLPDAAEVNGKQYKSLPRALNAARDGDTVKLLADHVTDADALNALGEDFTFEQYASIVPVVTKTLTLDLNHKTVDYLEVGFSETNEETQEKETLATGNLTVTSEATYGRILSLVFMSGTLDIRGGEIGGSEGEELVCDVNSGNATISGGTVLGLTVLEGATVTVKNGFNHRGRWSVDSGGTLSITGGTFKDVQFVNSGTIAISGGTFEEISNNDTNTPQPLMLLLAKDCAFVNENNTSDVQDGTKTSLTGVMVKEHTHTFENGKCACGVKVIVTDNNVNYYSTLQAALDAAANDNTITTVTLQQDLAEDVTFNGSAAGSLTLNMNGHKLEATAGIPLTVIGDELIIEGAGQVNQNTASNAAAFPAISLTGGKLVITGDLTAQGGYDSSSGRKPAIYATDGELDLQGNVSLNGGLTMLDNAKLTNLLTKGTFYVDDSETGYAIAITDSVVYNKVLELLAKDYAFYGADDSLANAGGARLSTGTYTIKSHTCNYTQDEAHGIAYCKCGRSHAHRDLSEEKSVLVNGVCPICGYHCPHKNIGNDGVCTDCHAKMVAKVTVGETTTYTADLADALNKAANGTTITLLADTEISAYVNIYAATATNADQMVVTLDLAGHTVTSNYKPIVIGADRNGTASYYGTLKIVGTGNIALEYATLNAREKGVLDLNDWTGGSISSVTVTRNGDTNEEGKLIVGKDAGHIGSLAFYNWTSAEITNTKLYGGSYGEIATTGSDTLSLAGLLPNGCAFKNADGSFAKATASRLSNVTVSACDHGGKNGFDESATACPYCNAPAVAETALSNGLWQRFADLQTAIDADRDGGAEFRLLTDVTGDYTINGTQGTALDLNGHSIKGTVTVKGTKGDFITTTLSNTENTTTVSIDKVVAYNGAELAGSKYPAVIGTLTLAEGATWKNILNDTALGYKVLKADGTHKWYAWNGVTGSQLNNVIINRLPITTKNLSFKVNGTSVKGNKVERGTTVQLCASCNASGADVSIYIEETVGNSLPIYRQKKAEYKKIGTSWYYVVDLDANKIGTYDIYFTASKDGYKVTSSHKKLTVTKPNLSNAEITFPYGNEAAFNYVSATGVPTFVVTYKGTELKENVDFVITRGASFSGVGSQTLTIRATANGDYTGSKSAEWTVRPLKVAASVGDIIKTYDGTTDLPANAKITFKSADTYYNGTPLPLAKGTDYEVLNAKYDSADASTEEKTVSFTIKLKNEGYVFEDGTKEKAFTLKGSETDKTFKINKATIASDTQLHQTVFNDLAKTYEIDLNQVLDDILPEGGKYGDIQYGKPSVSMYSDYYPVGGANIENGKLSLSINKAASFKQGDEIGTVAVEVETTNYQPFTLTIHVIAKDKVVPVLDGTISATDITYGKTLADSTLTVNGTMKDPNTREEVKGTFAWTNPSTKPNKAGDYQAEWTFTPAEGYEKYAAVTGTVTIKVNKADIPTSAITAPVANALTYNGNEQALLTAGSTQGGTMKYRLGESGEFVDSIPTGKNAGTYTVYFKVMGDGNHNDTDVQSVSVTIAPLPIRLCSVSSISKTYDGSADVTLTADKLTFFSITASRQDITLPDTAITFTNAQFTKEQADGSYLPSPEVGDGKALSFTMTLASDNYVFEGKPEGTKTISDTFATDDTTRFTITKAAAPTNIQSGTLNIINGTQQTYTYDFEELLPKLSEGEYGTISYGNQAAISVVPQSGYYYDETIVEFKNGVLTLAQFYAKDGTMTGQIGTVNVTVTTTNYDSFRLTLVLNAVNQIKPTPDGTISASEITYGDTLSKSEISGKMKDPNTGAEVKGTFSWQQPGNTILDASTLGHSVEWKFTPYAPEYATATGTVTIKVAPKSIEGATLTLEKDSLEYNAAEQSPTINGVTMEGWSETITYRIVSGDKATNANDSITLTVEGTGNYTGKAAVKWKITPREVTPAIEVASCTYTGDALEPTVTLKDGNEVIPTDEYTVEYSNNTNAGTGRVTIKDVAGGNYVIKEKTQDFTITKAAAPTNIQSGTLTITNGLHKTYSFDLSALLPKLTAPCDYGTITYNKKVDTNLGVGSFITLVNGKTGELTLEANRSGTDERQFGTITVTISTSNYEDITLTVNVSAVNQIKPVPEDGTISATPITYGNELSASTITGKMKDDGKTVEGTFEWTYPSTKPDKAGDYQAEWTFTPDESYGGKYTTYTDTATVKVDPKAVTVSGITAKDKVYDGTTNATLDCSNAKFDGILENDKLTVTATGTFESANAGKQKVKISGFKLGGNSVANNYVLAESGNQTETTATITVREATVTPYNQFKVYEEKDPDLTYAVSGVLDGETLKGITLTRTEGENAGKYAITATADAGANPNYDVTFAEGTLTIEPKSIKGAKVVLGKALTANGAEQTQTVEKVLLDGREIPADSYTVAGNTATAPDSHTLTITAKGNYTGTVKQTYVIAPAKAEDAPGAEIVIGSGKVKVVVKSEGAVPPATLLTDKAELLAMLVDSGDITADELAQIADGASVDIVLTVKEANVSAEIKTAMAQAAKDYTIGQYLDISLLKYMTVNGIQQADALHTTKDALTISVVVPDALINTNSAVNRTYYIVRNHKGTIDVLDAAFDAAGKTLTFKTDRFSIYAIAYKDTAVPSSSSNPSSNNSSNDSETKKNEVAAPTPAPTPVSTSKPSTITAMPQTGDTFNPTLYVVLLVASLLGLAVVFVCKKRNDK